MKRWKFKTFCALVSAFFVFAMASCRIGPPPYEFEGTWVAGGTRWNFYRDAANYNERWLPDTPYFIVNFTYTAIDTNAKHILLLVTSVTGSGSSFTWSVGDACYITYRVSDYYLYLDWSSTAYPASATSSYDPL